MHRQQWRRLFSDLHISAVALLPDKSSLAAEKLKECLRAEGGLEQLVYASQYHGTQAQPASTSAEADTCADGRYAPTLYGTYNKGAAVTSPQLRCCIGVRLSCSQPSTCLATTLLMVHIIGVLL